MAETAEWLAAHGHAEQEVEAAISRLVEAGALDDQRYARAFAADSRDLSGWGPERIGAALRDRGIDRRLIDEVCAEGHDQQVERASGLLVARARGLADDRERERALGYLTRRGYCYEVAHDAIRAAERAQSI